jgi:Dyp-type peroxidase family
MLPDADDIQGNIIRPYRFPVAVHLFLGVPDPGLGRAFVGRVAERVTNAAQWIGAKPASTVNLGFTWRGLLALGVAGRILDGLPPEFRQGMAARATQLGDTGGSAPRHWDAGLGTGDAHVLLSVNARSAATLESTVHGVLADAAGFPVVHTQATERLDGSREHFGFQDGIAQPAILGMPGQRPGDGVPGPGGTWLGLPLGEFVLGYPAADGTIPAGPPPPFGRNGTFLVYRKLEQDVAAFRQLVAGFGRRLPGGERLLAAKLMGRWPDGTPLALSPEREDTTIAADPSRRNDFRFADDPRGFRCPIGAHVRRANPRDGLAFHGALVNRHRLIRRGAPYGPPLPEGITEPDGIERGVLFYAFNASFTRQFEFIQTQWLNDGNALGLGSERDPVAGAWVDPDPDPDPHRASDCGEPVKMTIAGAPPRFVSPLPRLVTTRGGEYVWMPGLAALRALGSGLDGGALPPRSGHP